MEFTGERFVSSLTEPEISYEHWHRYLYTTRFVKDKVVLDIACGEGYGSFLLSTSNAKKVIGVDIDEEAVKNARNSYKNNDLEFVNGDVTSIPIESNKIDVIISFETIEHINEHQQKLFLLEIARVLKPDGILIISTPNKLTYSDLPDYKNEFHIKEFYVDEFLDFLRKEFEYIELLGQRIFTSSYIWSDKNNNNFIEYNIKQTENGYVVTEDKDKEMLYAITVCSNHKLPGIYSSVLIDKDDIMMKFKDNIINQKDEEYIKLHKYLRDTQNHIYKLEKMLQNRSIKFQFKKLISILEVLRSGAFSLSKQILKQPGLIRNVCKEVKSNGLKGLMEKVKIASVHDNYLKIKKIYKYEKLSSYPKISIIMPVYNVEQKWLKLAVESIINQHYDNWEFIIIDDGSTNNETIDFLKEIKHDKISITFNKENKGISSASNKAIELSTGEYIALLDNDDELREDALYEIACAINHHDPDVLYSDEAKVDRNGNKKLPFFKPDWSPDLLKTQMYIGHLLVFKKQLYNMVGGFNTKLDGSQDYDLMLRFSGYTSKIHHIPEVLYFWREIESSTSVNPDSKPASQLSGLEALNQHLKRTYGNDAYAKETNYRLVYDVRYKISEDVMISIIIPTKDKCDLLENCINSIIEKTSYENYEIIIMNNNSEEDKTYNWFRKITNQFSNIRVVDAFCPFNWSKINNQGALCAKGKVLVFLNNDTIVINSEWLTRLGENALRPDIGLVGGLLLYEDGTIQHAGVVVGMGGWADHVFKKIEPIHFGSPFISPMVTRNVSSVTGACLAISKTKFEELKGFNEKFIICGSDVDLSLKALKRGYFNLYNPYVNLYHIESKTRTSYIPDIDFKLSHDSYSEFIENGDPYYNINLSLKSLNPKIQTENELKSVN
jgi:GT2 family glycosyltransferase/ubiquinone/menaquinone biosynthesis C-methylase UbiE